MSGPLSTPLGIFFFSTFSARTADERRLGGSWALVLRATVRSDIPSSGPSPRSPSHRSASISGPLSALPPNQEQPLVALEPAASLAGRKPNQWLVTTFYPWPADQCAGTPENGFAQAIHRSLEPEDPSDWRLSCKSQVQQRSLRTSPRRDECRRLPCSRYK